MPVNVPHHHSPGRRCLAGARVDEHVTLLAGGENRECAGRADHSMARRGTKHAGGIGAVVHFAMMKLDSRPCYFRRYGLRKCQLDRDRERERRSTLGPAFERRGAGLVLLRKVQHDAISLRPDRRRHSGQADVVAVADVHVAVVITRGARGGTPRAASFQANMQVPWWRWNSSREPQSRYSSRRVQGVGITGEARASRSNASQRAERPRELAGREVERQGDAQLGGRVGRGRPPPSRDVVGEEVVLPLLRFASNASRKAFAPPARWSTVQACGMSARSGTRSRRRRCGWRPRRTRRGASCRA